MDLFESVFLVEHAKDFDRIAKATGGEYTEQDVRNEAYILAYEIGERRGNPIDFACFEERDLILGALSNKLVKRSDWRLKRAVRIDEDDDEEDSPRLRVFELPALPSSDPLVQLLAVEDMNSAEKTLTSSFSQFVLTLLFSCALTTIGLPFVITY